MIFLISTLLFSLHSWSFQISKDTKDQTLSLSAISCEEVTTIRNSLAAWTKDSKDHIICPMQTPALNKKGNLCKVDITQCVPEHVLKYHGVISKDIGPNCHNLVLVMAGILPGLRNVSSNEFIFYINSPLCKPLENDQQRMPGDIGAIRKIQPSGEEESHAFIYISDKIAYSKNGFGNKNDSPYALQSFNYVLDEYDVPNKKECHQNKIDRNPACPSALSFYRCESVEEYLKNTNSIPNELIIALKEIKKFETCTLGPSLIQGRILNPKNTQNLKDVTLTLINFLETQKREEIKNEKNSFVLLSLQLRLDSIVKQLQYVEDPSTKEMNDLSRIVFQETRKLTY
jgi:hypothetical protein